ncbi:MAG: hypothetical protein PHU14_16340 [Methylovulum sp.]|nr:hypothetical protein [Methylovulum sp.]
MTVAWLADVLLWCTLINYAVLIVWFVVFMFAHEWLYQLHGRWFRLSAEQFDTIHYAGMAVYKLGVLLLNLVPYLALCVVG